MVSISIIIPSYNSLEALKNNLPYLKAYIKEQTLLAEIILVDDGSNKENSLDDIAEEYSYKLVKYKRNQGKGFAIKNALPEATGDLILYTDADIPFEGSAIETIINYLSVKEYDLAIGDRSLENSVYFSKVSTKRRFGSGFFTFIVGRFITTGISDTQCGLKGFKKEVANDLFNVSRLKGFSFDVELIYISLKRNYDIKKIPVTLRSQDGNSVSVFKHGFSMAFDLLKIKWNHIKGLYSKQ